MPLPHAVAKTNRYWINPVARRVGARIPPFLLVHHIGRRSGKRFTTPVWAFRTKAGFIIMLTYGPRTDWLRNIQAIGDASATYRNREWTLSHLRVVQGPPQEQPLPWIVQRVIAALGVRDFLFVDAHPVDSH